MNNDINILILSCGTRNKIVQYFKEELKGKGIVVATDCSELAPALYFADKYYIVPKMGDVSYLETVLSICKENNIKAVISLIDPELSLIAKNKEAFLEIGALPIVSDFKVVEMCFDKYKMYEFLMKNGFPTIKSYINKDLFYNDIYEGKINFPVFVKPVKGSASNNISKVETKEEIELLFDRFDNLMIQEYMNGTEFGVDVYIDLIQENPVSIFIKEKIKMKAGETDKSISVKNEQLSKLVKSFIKEAKFKGVIDIDIFKVGEQYYISEVNPRFGGGYPHAHECGVNIVRRIINNVVGKVNKNIDSYEAGVYMMKYSDMHIMKI